MHLKNLLISVLATGALLVSGGVSAAEPDVRIDGSLETVSAEVVSVDMATRLVVLKSTEGEMVEILAGPEVRNLAQVKVGDMVDMEHSQVLVTELVKSSSGMLQRIETVETERAALGDKPAGAVMRTIDFRAKVHALDKEQRKVTLLGARGLVVLVVDPDVNLDQVSVGDMVEGSYIERVAIAVSPR